MNASTALIANNAGFGLAGPIGSFDAYLDRVSRIPVLDRARAQAQSMGRGRAGGHHAQIGAAQALADRQVPRNHVDDGRGNVKRGDLARIAP